MVYAGLAPEFVLVIKRSDELRLIQKQAMDVARALDDLRMESLEPGEVPYGIYFSERFHKLVGDRLTLGSPKETEEVKRKISLGQIHFSGFFRE